MENLYLYLLHKKTKSEYESYNNFEKNRRERVEKILKLVEKINESGETLSFPGIQPDLYLKMKKDDEEFPDYTTPIDKIIERCKKEGIKIVLGKYPESGNIFILPANSDNLEMDNISPYQLATNTIKNKDFKELILLTMEKKRASK